MEAYSLARIGQDDAFACVHTLLKTEGINQPVSSVVKLDLVFSLNDFWILDVKGLNTAGLHYTCVHRSLSPLTLSSEMPVSIFLWRPGTAHPHIVSLLTSYWTGDPGVNQVSLTRTYTPLLFFFLTSSTSSMGTLLSAYQERHPFAPFDLAHDLVVSSKMMVLELKGCELNPVVQAVIATHGDKFWIWKFLIVSISIILLCLHSKFRLVKTIFLGICVVYIALVLYQITLLI